MQGACFELTTLPRTISGTAPRPCFAALSRVQRTCADLPQNQADSRCRPNAATLSAVHKKVQGRPCIATAACAPNGKKVAKIAMPRGSKPGERRGGRQPGTPNKTTALINTAFAATTSNPGLSPLDFFLAVMRDPSIPPDWRFRAAQAAAPYVHPKPERAQAVDPEATSKQIEGACKDPRNDPSYEAFQAWEREIAEEGDRIERSRASSKS